MNSTPLPATAHVAIRQEQQQGGWWALFTAWVKGARR